jgi:hypothetical protein
MVSTRFAVEVVKRKRCIEPPCGTTLHRPVPDPALSGASLRFSLHPRCGICSTHWRSCNQKQKRSVHGQKRRPGGKALHLGGQKPDHHDCGSNARAGQVVQKADGASSQSGKLKHGDTFPLKVFSRINGTLKRVHLRETF